MSNSTMANEAKNDESCRRNYYRLDDEVLLGYRRVTLEEAAKLDQGLEPITESMEAGMASRLSALRVEASLSLNHVMTRDPVMGRYFKTLEERLEILAEEVFRKTVSNLAKILHKVNLSASGIAFNSDEEMREGSWLEIEYQLPDTSITIHGFGHVVRCCHTTVDEADKYGLAVDMNFLSDADRDYIVSTMLGRQAEQIRRTREREHEGDG